MTLLDIRQRSGYLFLAVMLGLILLISAQVNSRSGVPVIEEVTFGVFSEIQRGMSSAVSGIRQTRSAYAGLRHVKSENDELKRQLAASQIALQEQRALADRTRGLEKLLGMREQLPMATLAAQVIGGAATPDFRTVTLDKGTRDGLRVDMAIIAPAGVVGRLVVPSIRSAQVQLLVDRNAAAGAIVVRSRAQGVVVGGGDERLRMEFVSEAADILAGDVVMTSGNDGIFPKGFVIGHVETVEKNGPAYKRAAFEDGAPAELSGLSRMVFERLRQEDIAAKFPDQTKAIAEFEQASEIFDRVMDAASAAVNAELAASGATQDVTATTDYPAEVWA
jgi:rod shape-determining protein MreC